jgi:hypothetical protein
MNTLLEYPAPCWLALGRHGLLALPPGNFSRKEI